MTDSDDDMLRAFTDDEVECYRLWFEFLKLSDKAKWSADVALNFDLDYFMDESCNFEDWWPSHQYLFRKFKDIAPIVEIESIEDYLNGQDDGSYPEYPVVALFVHTWAAKDDIKAAFDEILKKYHKGKRGPQPFDGTGNVYDFYQRVDTQVLKKSLAVYKARIKPENDGMPLWQLEDEVSKEMPLINKDKSTAYSLFQPYAGKPPSKLKLGIVESWRKSQTLTVRRYLKCAEDILKNVVIGKFPVYTLNRKESAD